MAAIHSEPARDHAVPALGFLARVGLIGWSKLEPVVLAALATEAPVLLVGNHGTAKSMLAERLAAALGLAFRHYNASLINYDDLVGIPVPNEAGTEIRFIGSRGAVWEAEFAFFDEISRCRPDLQNKLFPLIHERRVAGVDLPRLRHRWGAMNPPAPEDADASAATTYLGSEVLDPALADRFAFVIRTPGWDELGDEERRALVSGRGVDDRAVEACAAPDLPALVAQCRAIHEPPVCELSERIADYVVHLVGLLNAAELPQSPRRARRLAENVLAVHAARLVLGGETADPEESARLALLSGVPQSASETPPTLIQLIGAHKQAWEVSGLARDCAWRAVLGETDPAKRVALAAATGISDEDLSRLITRALAAQSSNARRIGLATAIFLAFRDDRALAPAAWEPLAELARRVLEPRRQSEAIAPGHDLETWREISQRLALTEGAEAITLQIERNFLLGGFPDLWREDDWRLALDEFRKHLALLGVAAEARAPETCRA